MRIFRAFLEDVTQHVADAGSDIEASRVTSTFAGPSVQAEALPPETLAQIIKQAIADRIDWDAYHDMRVRERAMRAPIWTTMAPLLYGFNIKMARRRYRSLDPQRDREWPVRWRHIVKRLEFFATPEEPFSTTAGRVITGHLRVAGGVSPERTPLKRWRWSSIGPKRPEGWEEPEYQRCARLPPLGR